MHDPDGHAIRAGDRAACEPEEARLSMGALRKQTVNRKMALLRKQTYKTPNIAVIAAGGAADCIDHDDVGNAEDVKYGTDDA